MPRAPRRAPASSSLGPALAGVTLALGVAVVAGVLAPAVRSALAPPPPEPTREPAPRPRLTGPARTWTRETEGLLPLDPASFEEATRQTTLATVHEVTGRVVGPVAMLRVHRAYVCRATWPRPGSEVVEEIPTPPVTALHDFWITERGEHVPAALRARGAASREYQEIVDATRDPGLLEFVREGLHRFRLYPVLVDGTPKHAGWRQDSLVDAGRDGWVELPVSLGDLPIERFSLSLEVHDPAGIASFDLPAGLHAERLGPGRHRIRGTLERIAWGPSALVLRWRRRAPPDEGHLLGGGRVLRRVEHPDASDEGVTLWLLGRAPAPGAPRLLGHVEGSAVELDPASLPSLPVPAATASRLEAAARMMAAWVDPATGSPAERAAQIAEEAAAHRLVGPASSLFARPGHARDDSAEAGWLGGGGALRQQARDDLSRAGSLERSTHAPRPAPAIELSVVLPNFRAARMRANGRACFANQKTLAGALEMYNLDHNRALPAASGDHPTRAGRTLVTRFLEPAAGAEVVAGHWHDFRARGRAGQEWMLADAVATDLQQEGYLCSVPNDPGFGAGTIDHYVFLGGRTGILCLRHGAIQPPGGSGQGPRDQLRALGFDDPALLDLASEELTAGTHHGRRRRVQVLPLGEAGVLLLVAVLRLLWGLERLRPGVRRVVAGATGYLVTLLTATLATGSLSLVPATYGSFLVAGTVCGLLAPGVVLVACWRAAPAPDPKERE